MQNEDKKLETRTEVSGLVNNLVRPTAAGYVTYDVKVNCPHCRATLRLNQYPYDDEDTEFCAAENELEDELFGTPDKAAKWQGFEIEYKCRSCEKEFILNEFEI